MDSPAPRPPPAAAPSERVDRPDAVFPPSAFDRLPDEAATPPARGQARRLPPARGGRVFDVCHTGVVLRAVLFVLAGVAMGALFAVDHYAQWPGQTAMAAGLALPALLFWLCMACALRRPLAALSRSGQRLAAALLGAAAGGFGWALLNLGGLGLLVTELWLAPVLAGAMAGLLMAQWLQWRDRAQLPADTTARLAELQSRIRPHFLFNTLNTALSLVRLDPQRAEAVLEDLAELFRGALADPAQATHGVSLGDEVLLARRYLAIEQVRFGPRLQLVWDLDPAADAARLPPLLLQPLVENAVRHGVEPDPQGGVVRIRTRLRGGQVVVSIVNTVPAGPSQPGSGMALHNVRERLLLMHDVAAQFEARAEPGLFRVQMLLPL